MKDDRFSSSHLDYDYRASVLKSLSSCEYGVLVIGGGITGAGVVLDAASQDLSVTWIESKTSHQEGRAAQRS